MTALLPEQRTWDCIDPLRPYDPVETERVGTIEQMDMSGGFQTRKPELAQELKQRYPWMLVTEHEPQTGGQSVMGQSFAFISATWAGRGEDHRENWEDLGNGRWRYAPKPTTQNGDEAT